MTTQRRIPSYAQQANTSRKIEAIRVAARTRLGMPEREDSCPTCLRRACDPSRRRDPRGHVTEGCVDAYHHDAMAQHYPCESRWWHFRAEAHAIRKAELAYLESL